MYSIECPWLDNKVNLSSIPDGVYICKPDYYHGGDYPAVEITGVPGRTRILFHMANWPYQLKGCIALNARIGPGNWACPMRGFSSKPAFEHFMAHFGSEDFLLNLTSDLGISLNVNQ